MKIDKWGDTLAIRIPEDVAETLGLREGVDVDLIADAETRTLTLSRKMSRAEAIAGLRKYAGRLPADFKFDRDEANAR